MNRFVKGYVLGLGLAMAAAPAARAQSGGALLFNPAELDKVTVPGISAATVRTIEAWVRYTGPAFSPAGFGQFSSIIEFGNKAPFFGFRHTGELIIFGTIGGGTIPEGVWTHVAYTFDGTSSRVFIDGVLGGASGGVPNLSGVGMGIGFNSTEMPFEGYIDEVRLSSIARYTSNFTPPTAPFTPDLNTLALYHFDEPAGQAVTDELVNNGVLGSTAAVEANDPTRVAGDAPLPVELSRFVGSSTTAGVVLNWTTATERDNAGFTVLRDGVEIAGYGSTPALRGAGTSSQASSYRFVDSRVRAGERYTYQLRSIDLSGAQHDYPLAVSVEVTVKVQTPTPATEYALLGATPNPFNPTTEIRFTLPAAEPAMLAVYDGLGRLVRTTTVSGVAGLNRYAFDASALPTGTYTYRLQTGGFTKAGRMTLVR